jgi:hypothetical protein
MNEQVDQDDGERRGDGVLEIVPAITRIAASAWLRSAEWTVHVSRRLLRVTDDRLSARPPAQRRPGRSPTGPERKTSEAALRERGAELLRRSSDVEFDDDTHPAYVRILADLAPDEARILRLLAVKGPQAAVDVRTARPLNVGSQLVALGLTMIGAEAGCRHVDRVHAYLNNLNRLGLIWFSRERLPDPLSYQVLEAQPEVTEAMRRAGRARTVRRTIHLTPFGHDFCEMCLPLDTAEFAAVTDGEEGGAENNQAETVH